MYLPSCPFRSSSFCPPPLVEWRRLYRPSGGQFYLTKGGQMYFRIYIYELRNFIARPRVVTEDIKKHLVVKLFIRYPLSQFPFDQHAIILALYIQYVYTLSTYWSYMFRYSPKPAPTTPRVVLSTPNASMSDGMSGPKIQRWVK